MEKEKKQKITSKTKLGEIMNLNPESAMIFFEHGMHCIGCGMAAVETIEQGCKAHGMTDEEIKKLIERLNKK